MAHHGNDSNISPAFRAALKQGSLKKPQEQKQKAPTPGATKRFPQGKLNENDEGELLFGIAREAGKIVLVFGKPVAWVGFDPDSAIQLAMELIKQAGEVRGAPISIRLGHK